MDPLRILFVEDLQSDYELAKWQLKKEGLVFDDICVDTKPEFIAALVKFTPDLIISDYSMPAFNGLHALQITLERSPETPFIVLTGSMNEETAVECMRAEAADYVLKEKMHRLPFAVRETLKRYQERKEKLIAEKQLQESEEKFREVFDSANVGKAIVSNHKAIVVNQALADMLGYTTEELENLDWRQFTPEEDIKDNERIVTPLYNGEIDSVRYDKRYIHKDGTYVWVDISVQAHRDHTGNPEYFISTIVDITEKKKAELVLKESEEKFRSMFSNNHAVMMLLDPSNGVIVDINPAACAYYGYDQKELVSKKITEINTLTQEEVNAEMKKALLEERNYFNFQHRLANGDIRDVEVYSGPIQHMGKTLLYSIVHDVTDRKKAEEALKQKLDELMRFHRLTVDRELKMVELKKEVNELLRELDKSPRYKIVE